MNILITQDKNIKFLFKIYYLIFLLIVLSVLTSLIYANTFYQKSYTQKDIPLTLSHAEKDIQVSYIIDLKTAKSLQQNELIHDTRIDQIRETKSIPNIKVSQLPKDLKSIKSIKNRKELFIKITLPLIVQENSKISSLNQNIKLIKSSFDQISRKEAIWVQNLME